MAERPGRGAGRGVGQRARQLLTDARAGIRNAEERRSAAGRLRPDGQAREAVPNGLAASPAPDAPYPPDAPPEPQRADGPRTAGGAYPADGPADGAVPLAEPGQGSGLVPRWLQVAGGWAWRLLFIGIVIYLAYRVAGRLALVVIPCAGALLLTALLQPLAARLHRVGLPMLAATWCTLLSAVIVLAGTITFVTIRVRAEYAGLVTQVRHTSHQIQAWLAGPPLHLKTTSLQTSSNKLLTYLGQHKSLVAGTVLTGGQIVFEVLGGIVLMLFVTFFLIKDGERIWAWLTRAFGADGSQRANRPAAQPGRPSCSTSGARSWWRLFTPSSSAPR